MHKRTKLFALLGGVLALLGVPAAVYAVPVPSPDPCAIQGGVTVTKLAAYDKCRFDRIEKAIPGNQTVTVTKTAPTTVTAPPVTVTVTASPTSSSPAATTTAPPTTPPASSTTPTTTTAPPVAGWPDATNTGVAGCGPLEQVNNTSDELVITTDNVVVENKEFLNPITIVIRGGHNITIRCVKTNGSGWFGIDNTDRAALPDTNRDVVVDQVEINCKDRGQAIGMLLQAATITRANVHNCDHGIDVGGDNVLIKDNYCHDLTDLPVVHADCIQSTGGVKNVRIEHNALYSRDTSDILLGQEHGDASNVVIHNNLLGSSGSPKPAYLLYLSGTNTTVTDNHFTRDYQFGACTLNTNNPVTWSGNVWHDTGAEMPLSDCPK